MSEETTTIQVTTETWRELNAQKNPGESFDDVIRRLLKNESDE